MFSVECFQWDSYMEATDCIEQSLVNNFWASEEELLAMEEADISNLLIQKLNYYYDKEIHSIVDLSMREVTGDKGSLCGMAAMSRPPGRPSSPSPRSSRCLLTTSRPKWGKLWDMIKQTPRNRKTWN